MYVCVLGCPVHPPFCLLPLSAKPEAKAQEDRVTGLGGHEKTGSQEEEGRGQIHPYQNFATHLGWSGGSTWPLLVPIVAVCPSVSTSGSLHKFRLMLTPKDTFSKWSRTPISLVSSSTGSSRIIRAGQKTTGDPIPILSREGGPGPWSMHFE